MEIRLAIANCFLHKIYRNLKIGLALAYVGAKSISTSVKKFAGRVNKLGTVFGIINSRLKLKS